MGTYEDVAAILRVRKEQGKDPPTMRQLRTLLGNKGSMSTISAAVKTFQYAQLKEEGVMPDGFDDADLKAIGAVIWKSIEPVMHKSIENARSLAQKKVDIEKADAARVRQAAEEMMTEAQSIMHTNEELREKLEELKVDFARVNGALDESRRIIAEMEETATRLKATLGRALKAKGRYRLLKRRDPARSRAIGRSKRFSEE